MISKPRFFVPMLLAASLFAVACSDDDGVTPVCPTADDCVTKPGNAPPKDTDAGETEDDTSTGEDEESGEEA